MVPRDRVIRYHTPPDDFESWVSRQRGEGVLSTTSDASVHAQPSRLNLSKATIFVRVCPLRHVLEETRSEIRPRVCVNLSPSVIRCIPHPEKESVTQGRRNKYIEETRPSEITQPKSRDLLSRQNTPRRRTKTEFLGKRFLFCARAHRTSERVSEWLSGLINVSLSRHDSDGE